VIRKGDRMNAISGTQYLIFLLSVVSLQFPALDKLRAPDRALFAKALWHNYPQQYHFFATPRIRPASLLR
jgi:hypothetical protein